MEENQIMSGPPMEAWAAGKPWQWKEDGLTVTRTTSFTAPGCHNGCGLLVYTNDDGKVVKVEGDPDNPHTKGRLCPRCLCMPDTIYHEDRVLHPMKRDKARRGDPNGWERISWDEAYDIVEREFRRIIDTWGGDSIAVWRGTQRDINWPIGRLAYAMGSPNECSGPSGIACYLPRVSMMGMTTGAPVSPDVSSYLPDGRWDDERYEVPNCVIIWGNDPLHSNNIEYQMGWNYIELMKRGTKFVTVDPRITWIASKSAVHLQIRPGTDAALAMAIGNILIQEDLVDHGFIEKWVHGFEQYSERVSEWTAERAAEVCWVDADDIRAAARLFGEAQPAHIAWGVAVDMQFNGVTTAMAIQALWIITGNFDRPGGMVPQGMPFGIWQPCLGGWGIDELPQDVQAKRVGQEEYPMFRYGITFAQPDVILERAEAGDAMKGIWIQTTNLLACAGQDPERWEAAMGKAEFVACVDIFMTPTAQALADVFLPVATWVEKDSMRAHNYYVSTINKIIEPLGEAKSDLEIDLTIGRRFDPDHFWPWETEREALDAVIAPTGMTFDELRDHGNAYQVYDYFKHEKGVWRNGEPGFNTPTGKLELYSTVFEMSGLDPLPSFNEPNSSPVSAVEDYEGEYPLILITGARQSYFFHSENRQIKHLRQFNPDPRVDMNAKTAADLGVAEGQWVWIENRRGRCRQRVRITESMRDRMVSAQSGWWYPEDKESRLFGMPEVNINNLLDNKPASVGYGADIKSVLCKVYPVAEGEM